MPVGIGARDEAVVVNPVIRAGVVRRVNVDQVDLALVGIDQRLERIVILTLDHDMRRLLSASLDLAERREAWINRVAEVLDDDELVVVVRYRFALVDWLLRRIHRDDRSDAAPAREGDLVLLLGISSQSHNVTATRARARNLEILRKVALEDEAEVLVLHELRHLICDLRPQMGILDSLDEVVDMGHELHRTGANDDDRGGQELHWLTVADGLG